MEMVTSKLGSRLTLQILGQLPLHLRQDPGSKQTFTFKDSFTYTGRYTKTPCVCLATALFADLASSSASRLVCNA